MRAEPRGAASCADCARCPRRWTSSARASRSCAPAPRLRSAPGCAPRRCTCSNSPSDASKLERDVHTAIVAMESADARLATINDPAVREVRAALGRRDCGAARRASAGPAADTRAHRPRSRMRCPRCPVIGMPVSQVRRAPGPSLRTSACSSTRLAAARSQAARDLDLAAAHRARDRAARHEGRGIIAAAAPRAAAVRGARRRDAARRRRLLAVAARGRHLDRAVLRYRRRPEVDDGAGRDREPRRHQHRPGAAGGRARRDGCCRASSAATRTRHEGSCDRRAGSGRRRTAGAPAARRSGLRRHPRRAHRCSRPRCLSSCCCSRAATCSRAG